ncbi:hypothetical protein GC163_01885 [bacterium]|nr:hypothetical protein [bacterium]
MLDFLNRLDRRWIFLLMALAVAVPVLCKPIFPEQPSPLTRKLFDTIEELPEGSVVYMAFDYDPPSQAELGPMAKSFVRHCCLKKHKMIFANLWPAGPPLVDENIRNVVNGEFASENFVYGEDYVNLGYRPGNQVAITQIATDLRKIYPTDATGKNLGVLPLTRSFKNIFDADLVLNVSAGYPGCKEWVQYAGTKGDLKIGAGVTGVQAPQLFPYYPDQLVGILAAIKGAAEYEAAIAQKYPQYADPQKNEAIKRMGPQLFAHLLMLALIVLGNVVHVANRRRGGVR